MIYIVPTFRKTEYLHPKSVWLVKRSEVLFREVSTVNAISITHKTPKAIFLLLKVFAKFVNLLNYFVPALSLMYRR